MIALDTNVLLRILLDDDPMQSRRAQDVVDRAVIAGEAVLLPDIVLCEVEWVLASTYDAPRARIAETLRRLTEGREFTFANRSAVMAALDSYERGREAFSDYLIGAAATAAGAARTFTFDRQLRDSEGFALVRG